MSDLRSIRLAAGYSQIRAAVEAGTAPQTLRLFEDAGPDAVTKPDKRRALVALYERLAKLAAARRGCNA
ncbi:MAG: hypothetical protein IT348_20035 [Candidatus Eisenbacteria bacterium]|nr:hypothetical protein [Candidatus Eisenbacteria bacterium]